MILIRQSWCGRQRVSLKLELGSTAEFALSPHTSLISVSKVGILHPIYTYFPNAIFQAFWVL